MIKPKTTETGNNLCQSRTNLQSQTMST